MNIYQRRKQSDPQYLEKVYARRRQRKYGISSEVFEEMKTAQGGRCAICRRESDLCVDHDHTSGVVRGLLCESCNKGLGFFRDNSATLRRAMTYLLKGGVT